MAKRKRLDWVIEQRIVRIENEHYAIVLVPGTSEYDPVEAFRVSDFKFVGKFDTWEEAMEACEADWNREA